MKNTNKQLGAVSLFVVIFSALLITIVTVSFVRIMIQNQQQATYNDLSQSAYDSALAGVEDAKRAILQYNNKCNSGDCGMDMVEFDSLGCNEAVGQLSDIVPNKTDGEVKVKTSEEDLNQAYTCVKIKMITDDVSRILEKDQSTIVPLIGVSSFNKIKIDWFSSEDLGVASVDGIKPPLSSLALLRLDDWIDSSDGLVRPSIMRTQLIEYKNEGFSLNDFDDVGSEVASNTTLFLYPSSVTGTSSFDYTRKNANSVGSSPVQAMCNSDNFKDGGYACSVELSLPAPVALDSSNPGDDGDHTAYLILKSLYRRSSFSVQLLNNENTVPFKGVQPEVDSTGRADNKFRRVKSRVELTNVDFPYPDASVNISGNLCKNFLVTDNPEDYNGNNCTP